MKKDVTLQDIAFASGVSIATVSRVLNQKESVSAKTQKKVLRAVGMLGASDYLLPETADAPPKLIAVILSDATKLFAYDVLSGIQKVAYQHGYETIIMQHSSADASYDRLVKYIKGGVVDGVITLTFSYITKTFVQNFDSLIPLVQCTEYDPALPYPYVSTDDYLAAYKAVSYLISAGYKKIALFNSSTSLSHGFLREKGYLQALEDHNIVFDPKLMYNLNQMTFEIAQATAKDIFRTQDIPEAFFCTNDNYAAAIIQVANTFNIKVPQDVAVLGFDNTEIAKMTVPAITTVNQNREALGAASAQLLINMIHGKQPLSMGTFLEGELIVRSST